MHCNRISRTEVPSVSYLDSTVTVASMDGCMHSRIPGRRVTHCMSPFWIQLTIWSTTLLLTNVISWTLNTYLVVPEKLHSKLSRFFVSHLHRWISTAQRSFLKLELFDGFSGFHQQGSHCLCRNGRDQPAGRQDFFCIGCFWGGMLRWVGVFTALVVCDTYLVCHVPMPFPHCGPQHPSKKSHLFQDARATNPSPSCTGDLIHGTDIVICDSLIVCSYSSHQHGPTLCIWQIFMEFCRFTHKYIIHPALKNSTLPFLQLVQCLSKLKHQTITPGQHQNNRTHSFIFLSP